MPRLRLPGSAFGLNGYGGRQCRFRCAWLCLFSFPGGRPGSSSDRGRHVARRRRGCLKDGLAEAAATAAGGGGGSGGSGSGDSVSVKSAGCPSAPHRGQCPWTLPLLRRLWGPVRRQRPPLRGDTKVFPGAQISRPLCFPCPTCVVLSSRTSAPQLCNLTLNHTGVPCRLVPAPSSFIFCTFS